jgi:uncharacterized protein YecT (DUF1311 family)
MRKRSVFLFIILFNSLAFGQTGHLLSYSSHKFPCDSGTTTLDINRCSGIRLDYADSLLNDLYDKIIKSLDKEIVESQNKLKLEQSKKDTAIEHKETIQFLIKDVDYNQRLKESIVKSQREWIKVAGLNLEVIEIMSEGGTGFVAEENQSLIDDDLERIKKLDSFYYIDK